MSDREQRSTDQRLRGLLCPVHPDHSIALVGEAPGPRTRGDLPFYPYPPSSAAGRFLTVLGWSRRQYLLTFARTNLLAEWPGETFPVARARDCVPTVVAQLHPRPMLLMGRGVARAFGLADAKQLELHEVELPHEELDSVLARVAIVPHTSGRNLWYNDPDNREAVRRFVDQLAEEQIRDPTDHPVPLLQG